MIINSNQSGFTIPELLAIILVASLFALSAFQLNQSISNMAGVSSRNTTASNLAYSNLRKYANGAKPLWFNCIGDETGESAADPNLSDAKTYPNAPGQQLLNSTSSTPINNLTAPVIQKVFATAPYGCGLSGSGLPIRIQSQITYGNPARTITHATFVTY